MKRSALTRKTPLARGESELSRVVGLARKAGLTVTSGPKPKPKPKRYDLDLAKAWHEAVVKGKACVVCGVKRDLDGHHALGKNAIEQHARSAGLTNEQRNALLWDPRNGIPLCREHHAAHETASRRVPRYLLTAEVWEFARDLGEWAVMKLERTYPQDERTPSWET